MGSSRQIASSLIKPDDLMTLREASVWASEHLNKRVTTSNIAYLVQYGRVHKFGENGSSMVSRRELETYYKSFVGNRELSWRGKLGDDLDWHLSFDQLREVDTTKHVHRLTARIIDR